MKNIIPPIKDVNDVVLSGCDIILPTRAFSELDMYIMYCQNRKYFYKIHANQIITSYLVFDTLKKRYDEEHYSSD